MPSVEQISAFEDSIEQGIDAEIKDLTSRNAQKSETLRSLKALIMSEIQKDQDEEQGGTQKISDDLKITSEELKTIFEEISQKNPEISAEMDFNSFAGLFPYSSMFSPTETKKITAKEKAQRDLLQDLDIYDSEISVEELLLKEGKSLWGVVRQDDTLFKELKNIFTPEQLSKTFEKGGGNLWQAVEDKKITFGELKEFFTAEQLSRSLEHGGKNLWWAVVNEKIIFSELKEFFTAEQLSKTFEDGAYALWQAVSYQEIAFTELKEYFTPEQLSKSFKDGGHKLWWAVVTEKITFTELKEFFTPEQLSKTFEERGYALWQAVSHQEITFTELKKYFTSDQLSRSFELDQFSGGFETGGLSFWFTVETQKITFTELKEFFTPEQLSKSFEDGAYIFWKLIKDGVIPLSEIMDYFILPKSLESSFEPIDFAKIVKQAKTPEEKEYLSKISPLKTSEYLEEKLQKDSYKKFSSPLVGSIKTKFGKDGGDFSATEYNELMRTINHLHDSSASTNNEIRKEMVENIAPTHLYNLLIHGRQELFTSTSTFVNHILPKILRGIESKGGLSNYLKAVDPQQKNTPFFIEVFARYGKIQDILKYFEKEEDVKNLSESLLSFDISSGDFNYDAPLTALRILNFLQKDAQNKEQNQKFIATVEGVLLGKIKNSSGKLQKIYALLGTLYKNSNGSEISGNHANAFSQINSPQAEKLGYFNEIPKSKLFTPEKRDGKEVFVHRHFQVFLEGGDGDGKRSRESMATIIANTAKSKRNRYLQSGFKIDNGLTNRLNKREKNEEKLENNDRVFVLYKEKKEGGKTYRTEVILSNVMSSRDPQMTPNLRQYLLQMPEKTENPDGEISEKKSVKNIHSISYRGHSTYVQEVSRLFGRMREEKPEIFDELVAGFWGSCGATSSLKEFQKGLGMMPPSVATSGTGTSDVNSPVIGKFLDSTQKINSVLNWGEFNQDIEDSNLSQLSKFKDYEFPQKNIGAQFISAISSILEK